MKHTDVTLCLEQQLKKVASKQLIVPGTGIRNSTSKLPKCTKWLIKHK